MVTAPTDVDPVSQEGVNGLAGETLPQGCWNDDDYLWLTDRCRRLVEFTDGYLEMPSFPTRGHQRILAFLHSVLHGFLVAKGGEALLLRCGCAFAPASSANRICWRWETQTTPAMPTATGPARTW